LQLFQLQIQEAPKLPILQSLTSISIFRSFFASQLQVLSAPSNIGVDHVCFLSVCSEWRGKTEPHQKAPLLILFDLDKRTDTIKGISFFDIICKEVIQLPFLAPFFQGDHYYLGSSHGLIFIGQLNHQCLTIQLVNPLTRLAINICPLEHIYVKLARVYLLVVPGCEAEVI